MVANSLPTKQFKLIIGQGANCCDIIFSSYLFQITRKFCPHHVGHWLGMDVHDTSSVPRSTELAPGMVLTIEPGKWQRGFVLVSISVRFKFLIFIFASSNLAIFTKFMLSSKSFHRVEAKLKQFFVKF